MGIIESSTEKSLFSFQAAHVISVISSALPRRMVLYRHEMNAGTGKDPASVNLDWVKISKDLSLKYIR